jgi:hypothetical protein
VKEFLLRKEAAQYLSDRGLPTSPNTLQKYATVGGGPEYQKFGNRAVYKPTNLDKWAEQKLGAPRSSTSCAA